MAWNSSSTKNPAICRRSYSTEAFLWVVRCMFLSRSSVYQTRRFCLCQYIFRNGQILFIIADHTRPSQHPSERFRRLLSPLPRRLDIVFHSSFLVSATMIFSTLVCTRGTDATSSKAQRKNFIWQREKLSVTSTLESKSERLCLILFRPRSQLMPDSSGWD